MQTENIPHAFAMALSQNAAAANTFAMMTQEQKHNTLERAAKASSGRRMGKLIEGLAQEQDI